MKNNLAVFYLIGRFFYRIKEFLRHWYVKSFYVYSHGVISFLEKLDRFFAFKITFRHFFQPLYQDYSLIGYILGFIFRSSRIIIAATIYVVIIAIAIIIYFFWLVIPFFILYKIFL